jgi:tRNA dimethylallyltransferase
MKQRYILIHGPTGVGKSAAIDAIGKDLSIEVVNCDVGQFYRPFSIGTAKPDWRNAAIPHHLFDIIEEPYDFSVIEYRNLIKTKIEEILKRGNTPVLVGGSGFYGKSLFFPPVINEQVEIKDTSVQDTTWELLYALDPERARSIHKNDGYRVQRALSIVRSTGKNASLYVPEFNPLPGDCLVLFLTRDREELYNRINKRTIEMFDTGWIQEVQKLKGILIFFVI